MINKDNTNVKKYQDKIVNIKVIKIIDSINYFSKPSFIKTTKKYKSIYKKT